MSLEEKVKQAEEALDANAVEMVKWHFSPASGCAVGHLTPEHIGDLDGRLLWTQF